MSLGGSAPSSNEIDAIRYAAANDVVVVISSGNDGDRFPDPFASGSFATSSSNVIIVGSVNENGVASDFSNGATGYRSHYIAALGEDVYVVFDGSGWLISGTSFSAPQVSGAVALIAQAFPNLTAPEIIELLMTTAQDVGEAGPDDVYGQGIMNIREAFQPQGRTTLAGSQTAVATIDDVAIGSTAMGDALVAQGLRTLITDRFDRAFGYDIGSRMQGAQIAPRLQDAVSREVQFSAVETAAYSVSFTTGKGPRAGGLEWTDALRLTKDDADRAKFLAASVAARVSPDLQLGVGIAQGASGLVAQLQGSGRTNLKPAFLVAPSATGEEGRFSSSDMSLALRHKTGPWGLTLHAEKGDQWLGDYRFAGEVAFGVREHRPSRSIGLAVDREFGPLQASLGMTWKNEDGTVLGGYFGDFLGVTGADSAFIDFDIRRDLGSGWRAGAALRGGMTSPRAGSIIGGGSTLWSNAWSIDLARQGMFSANDSLGLRVSQSLRIEDGGFNLVLPVAYDYATESPIYGTQHLNLAPDGREIMGELAWRGPLMSGNAAASLFYRKDPGHYASEPDDAGVVLRWDRKF